MTPAPAGESEHQAAEDLILESQLATTVGLCLALFGPALLFMPCRKLTGQPERVTTRVLELLFLWVLAGSIVAIVIWWENLPFASIGLQLKWQSVVLGLLLALLFNRVVAPFLYWMIHKTGIHGFESGLAKMVTMPVWFLLFAALTGGVVEETLYRGYAIERLASVIGSYWWAGLIVTMVCALMHLPMWGWGPVTTFFVSGGVLTLFYIATQDLLACMIAHTITDAVGFISARRIARSS
jgi:uncharacterized protein